MNILADDNDHTRGMLKEGNKVGPSKKETFLWG